jgi:hypothetical protein
MYKYNENVVYIGDVEPDGAGHLQSWSIYTSCWFIRNGYMFDTDGLENSWNQLCELF